MKICHQAIFAQPQRSRNAAATQPQRNGARRALKAEPAGGFDPAAAAARVVAAMRGLAGAERAAQAKVYLKSDLDFLGVSVP